MIEAQIVLQDMVKGKIYDLDRVKWYNIPSKLELTLNAMELI